MNQKNYTSNEDFDDWVDLSDISSKLKKIIEDYINWDEEYKQNYWDDYFCRWLYPLWSIDYPVDIKDFREKHKDIEPNIERFLPWIIKAMEENTGEEWVDIEGVFTLDEEARKYLEKIWYLQQQEIRIKIIEIVWNKKEQEILWENISFDELIERIWDLYYNSLSSFLFSLSEHIYDTEISELLKKASKNISNAWDICEKPTLEFLEKVKKSGEKVEFKHTSEVKWIKTSNEELAKIIWNLVSYKLSDFLEKLSAKIHKDWIADEWRERIKLSNELYACAEKLKLASEKIK